MPGIRDAIKKLLAPSNTSQAGSRFAEPGTSVEPNKNDVWTLQSSRLGQFAVALPGKPREETIAVPERPVVHALKLQKSGFSYFACCRDYAALGLGVAEVALMEERRSAQNQLDFEVRDVKEVEFAGKPGREFLILYGSGTVICRRLIVEGQQSYQADLGWMPGEVSESVVRATSENFFSSFALTNAASPAISM